MGIDEDINSEIDDKKPLDSTNIEPPDQQSSNRSSYPLIAGILLIIAGILGIFNWVQTFSLDAATLGSLIDANQITELYPSITTEQILGFLQTCALIGIIISIFPILGGIFAIKKKLYYIALTGSIIGLFSIGIVLTSSILSLIGLVVLILSKQQFQ
jgi:hypothetical protein